MQLSFDFPNSLNVVYVDSLMLYTSYCIFVFAGTSTDEPRMIVNIMEQNYE
jgi:hypothetical protein